jgi:hypothetical protein
MIYGVANDDLAYVMVCLKPKERQRPVILFKLSDFFSVPGGLLGYGVNGLLFIYGQITHIVSCQPYLGAGSSPLSWASPLSLAGWFKFKELLTAFFVFPASSAKANRASGDFFRRFTSAAFDSG